MVWYVIIIESMLLRRTRLHVNMTAIRTSAIADERSHIRAGQCNLGLRLNCRTIVTVTVSHIPPATKEVHSVAQNISRITHKMQPKQELR